MKTYFKNYYALFDPVSNQIHQLFSKIPNLNSLLSQQWNGWIWSNRFSSFEIIFKYHFKTKLINFEARTSFGCQNSSCSSSNPLLSFFFFLFEPCQFVVLLATCLIPSLQVAVRIYRMSRVTYEWQTARCIIGLPR